MMDCKQISAPGAQKTKCAGLDVFRVLAALIVFLFHSWIHIGCTFDWLTDFVSMGAVFMTGFFMLSGYCLYLGYHKKELTQLKQVGTFYKKRFLGIMPIYYAVGILYIFIMGKETWAQVLKLAPIQILGLQSAFSSLFAVSHNGGTWFISCLVICYLFYPFVQEMIKQMSAKGKWILLALMMFLVFYGPVTVRTFGTQNIYSNPLFRGVEFLIGVLLASGKEKLEEKKQAGFLFHWWTFAAEFAVLILGITYLVRRGFAANDYMAYNRVAAPIFMLMIVTLSGIPAKRLGQSRILSYATKLSYIFFFAQFFTWEYTRNIMERIGTQHNKVKLIVSFTLCSAITIFLYEIVEKRLIKGLLLKKFL